MGMIKALRNAIIRNRAKLHEMSLDRYQVRIARTAEEYDAAFRLVHVGYAFRGIESVSAAQMRITEQHLLPEATVFVVYEGEMPVATITITLDSPAGLPLEKDYPEEIGRLRKQGAVLVEAGSLAVVQRCWRTGVPALLIMALYWFSTRYLGATHCVIGVDPPVARLYNAIYDLQPMGPPREHGELAAKEQGMVLDYARAKRFFRKHHTRRMSDGMPTWQRFDVQLPECIEMPPEGMSLQELVRWKLPREVFQRLFVEKSDRLRSLGPIAREYLECWRSKRTLETPTGGVIARRLVGAEG